jgi:hypothetical protein
MAKRRRRTQHASSYADEVEILTHNPFEKGFG